MTNDAHSRQPGALAPVPPAPQEPGTPPRRRARRTPTAPPASEPSTRPSTGRGKRSTPRPRENAIQGLAERALAPSTLPRFYPLADGLLRALPDLRQALLNRPFDVGSRALAEGIAAAAAPAVVQVWTTDAAPGIGASSAVGGLELFPALRLRAEAQADVPSGAMEAQLARSQPGAPRLPTQPDALVQEVVATRQPVVLYDAAAHPLAAAWQGMVASGPGDAPLETLAAYPLRARGQFLGVLAVGSRAHLAARHLAAIEDLTDVAALAADRDRLLSYSRSQEALAQTVVRHAPVAVAVLTGADRTFALVNPAFTALLGAESGAEVVGRTLSEVAPERARDLADGLRIDAVYEAGEPQAMIELPIHLDSGMSYWNVTSTPLPGISTNIGGVLVAAVEVTRQVIARQRAQESAEVAQERIGQMMMLHATSLAVASQLGADPRELLADILRRSIALLDAQAGTIYVREGQRDALEVVVCQGLRGEYTGSRVRVGDGLTGQVAQTGQGLIVDDYSAYTFRAAIYDGEPFSAIIAVPLIHHGQVVGVLEVLDAAERRTFSDDDLWLLDLFAAQAAQAIENARIFVQLDRAFRKQRELDRMKDDFIATASHELRTPLTGVQGFLDLLVDYSGSRDEPLALEFLAKAVESAQELAEIADRLLQTSRLDTGRMELHANPLRLAPVVEAVLRQFRELRQAQGTTHELVAEVPSDVYLHADLGRLKEVLDNLVGNAIKYSPHGGRVVVRCAPLGDGVARAAAAAEAAEELAAIDERPTVVLPQLTRLEQEGGDSACAPAEAVLAAAAAQPYYLLTVSDEGMGIPPGEQPRLFGRFARTESARISQIRGTGLGLYICRHIARAMGGDVWLQESRPGEGSTFAFALPAALTEATPTPATLATLGGAAEMPPREHE